MNSATVLFAGHLIERRPAVVDGTQVNVRLNSGTGRLPIAKAVTLAPVEGDPLSGAPIAYADGKLDDGERLVRTLLDGFARNEAAMEDYRARLAAIDPWAANALLSPIGVWQVATLMSETRHGDWIKALRLDRSSIHRVLHEPERSPDEPAIAA